jgi:hypothetical protein
MLLSRFWYVVLSLLLGAMLFVLFLAQSMYNRAGDHAMAQALSSDSQVVSWYLQADARQRSALMTQFAIDPDIKKYLDKSSKADDKVPQQARDKVEAALKKVAGEIPKEFTFDAVFAVDQHGRVVAHLGYDQARGMEQFELGGYPVVADALHGYLRDDTLVLDRIYRVVARPVQTSVGAAPSGAIVGARIIDNKFARELSQRTGAAIAFYTGGAVVHSAAPEGFDKSQLDQVNGDVHNLETDENYQEIGRSQVRVVGERLGVVYARMPGEAWELGTGYAVGRLPTRVEGPLGFYREADDKDMAEANALLAAGLAVLGTLLGLVFTILEHTRPLQIFRREAGRLAKGQEDQLLPSRFRGIYRKIAVDLNDGIDQVAAKGGVPRKAADLGRVLGDLPAEPQMSAFSFPGEGGGTPASSPTASEGKPLPSAPQAASKKLPAAPSRPGAPPPSPSEETKRSLPKPPSRPGAPPSAPEAGAGDPEAEREAEWRQVFEEFVVTKQKCGENVDGFTYEKFEQTLKKNQDALMKRHGARRVKFSVYVKEGKAALKASPMKD